MTESTKKRVQDLARKVKTDLGIREKKEISGMKVDRGADHQKGTRETFVRRATRRGIRSSRVRQFQGIVIPTGHDRSVQGATHHEPIYSDKFMQYIMLVWFSALQ